MRYWKQHSAGWSDGGTRGRSEVPAEVPYEKTARVVLRDVGLVLASALGFAVAVNIALVALHIG